MKILTKGKPKSERPWRGQCRDCESVIEAVKSELVITSDQRDGDFATARCPVCNLSMYFNEVKT